MTPRCCKDFTQSHLGTCSVCNKDAQVMANLNMCQTCILGEASNPAEEFFMHTITCKAMRGVAHAK